MNLVPLVARQALWNSISHCCRQETLAEGIGTFILVAVIGGIWQHHWVYWVAPILKAQLALLAYQQLSNGFRDLKTEIV